MPAVWKESWEDRNKRNQYLLYESEEAELVLLCNASSDWK